MRFVFALLVLAFVGMAGSTAFAAETDKGLIFEPTAEQSAQDWKAIKAQQDLYLEAKGKADWTLVRKYALFHFTRAWAYNNEAFERAVGAWDDADTLKAAKALYEKALAECDLAEAKGRYLSEVADCRKKASRTLASVNRRLGELEK